MRDDENLTGVYKAIVTDTSCYRDTGMIKTRISVFNMYCSPTNLLNSYDAETYENSLVYDSLTYIMMPFGGGYNYGMFKLPEVNTVGLVSFINGNIYTPVWIGGLPNISIESDSSTIISNETPSDSVTNNYSSAYRLTASQNVPTDNVYDEHALVIKTKENTFSDASVPDRMDMSLRPAENTVIMSREKTHIVHNLADEVEENDTIKSQDVSSCYQEIKMSHELGENGRRMVYTTDKLGNDVTSEAKSHEDVGNRPEASMTFNFHVGTDNEKRVDLNSDSIIIKNKKDNYTSKITFLDDGTLQISASEQTEGTKNSASLNEATITMSPASLELSSGSNKITLIRNIDESQEGIELSCNKLSINASDGIAMGSTGHYLLAAPYKGNITLEDGTMLSTIDNIMV